MARQDVRSTTGQDQLYESVVDTIGNTPWMKINNLAPDGVNLSVKAELFNPAGSVEDRLTISIISEAEKWGHLKPGQTLVETTSGNAGNCLAMVSAATGYPLVITMADSFSIERRRLMRFLWIIAVCWTGAIKAVRWTGIVEYFTALWLKGRSPFNHIFRLL